MTVRELRELLASAPEDMIVMVMVEDHLHPGMFAFAEACTCESGVSELADENGTPDGEKIFLVLSHGAGVTEDDMNNEEGTMPQLN